MNTSVYKFKIKGKNDHAVRYQILKNDQNLTFEEVFSLWQTSADFRDFYISILENSEFKAFYWEHPGLIKAYLSKPYEFILQKSASLQLGRLNSNAFGEYFKKDKLIVDFDNLGKNARLIVPTPVGDLKEYKHFAKFISSVQNEQKHEIFVRIGQLMSERISKDRVIWLNTAGDGVLWLHIRLDSRPKYYKTNTYRSPDFLK